MPGGFKERDAVRRHRDAHTATTWSSFPRDLNLRLAAVCEEERQARKRLADNAVAREQYVLAAHRLASCIACGSASVAVELAQRAARRLPMTHG